MEMVAFVTAVAAAVCHLLLRRFWLAVVISTVIGVGLSAVLSFVSGHFGWGAELYLLGLFALACGVSGAIGLLLRRFMRRSGGSA